MLALIRYKPKKWERRRSMENHINSYLCKDEKMKINTHGYKQI